MLKVINSCSNFYQIFYIFKHLCKFEYKSKEYIEIKNVDDEKLKFVVRKSLLTFYEFLSITSNFVNVFRIECEKIITGDRNEKKFRNISNAFELNRFRFCDFSFDFIDATKVTSTVDAAKVAKIAKTTIVVDVVKTMNADNAIKNVAAVVFSKKNLFTIIK